MSVGPDDELFTLGHFFGEYLPRKIMFLALPIAFVTLIFNRGRNAQIYLFVFVGLMSIAQGYNYYHASQKHNELAAKYGERYFEKLNHELESVGLNRLIDRFWTGLAPE